MSYRMEYECRGSYPVKRRNRLPLVFMTLLSAFLFCGTVYRLWPEGAAVMDRLLSFESLELTRSALETMALEVRNGAPISDAVTAFCREIVNHGLAYAA